jgi:hypothetical protein
MTDPQVPPATPPAVPPAGTPPAGTAPAAGDPPPATDPPKNNPPKPDPPKAGEPFVDDDGEKFEFPTGKAIADMKPEEQTEYWRHKAKKHESAFKKAAGEDMTPEKFQQILADREKAERDAMSAQERAVADARKEAREEALKETHALTVRAIMDAHVAASGLDKADPDNQDVIDAVQALDPSQFIKDDHVDADRLTKVLARIVPDGGGGKRNGTWPDTGQGNRQTGTGSARDAGRAEAERRGYLKADGA